MSDPLVVVGDSLLDQDIDGDVTRISPEAPVPVLDETGSRLRPGGAALAAALAAAARSDVTLITAVGDDGAGAQLKQLLVDLGVRTIDLGCTSPTPEKIRLRTGSHAHLRLDRGGVAGPIGPLGETARSALCGAPAVLVADYGRGLAAHAEVRSCLGAVRGPIIWDPHPRGATVLPGAMLVTPNHRELPTADRTGVRAQTEAAESARKCWRAHGVALTLGRDGAIYVNGDGPPLVVRDRQLEASDTCGAGDSFAAAALVALGQGALPSEAVLAAVTAATHFVERGGASAFPARLGLDPTSEVGGACGDGVGVARAVRARGGTVIAAGGCFDLLHAGHIAFLQAARRLGDCLVVCLNSDASVRTLKGSGRPLVSQQDRAGVLQALDCVDGVEIFDEATPGHALGRLRPHVFAKGGDYARGRLPEQDILDDWSGQCVVLPYVHGYSTTRIIEGTAVR
ncbi:MAG TPA: PfkB family carbohydrate kinase [Acidimicrobiales bacterium]|jgi:rfaE bifunctional protein nucleotidyltransferase chain/domain/rfaE bifunctional protein kinase chain/domain|nr:PfkB family carbohydrate kinase [Acidimicrobiales bacterium]